MIRIALFCAAFAAFFIAASTRADVTLPNLPVGTLLGSALLLLGGFPRQQRRRVPATFCLGTHPLMKGAANG